MHSFVTVKGLAFEWPSGRNLFQDLHFSLNARVTALVGPNGVGKTTLARLIAGELEPSAGHILWHGAGSYFSQRENPPAETVEVYLSVRYSWSILGEELLQGIDPQTFCDQLSGGEWMRVRLAAHIQDQFLVLDEPTNNLDRSARDILHSFISKYQHGILLISHDRELLALCGEVLELSQQGLQKYGGDWSHYEECKTQEREAAQRSLEKAKREREKAKMDRVELLERQEKRNRRGKSLAAKGGVPKIVLGAMKRKAEVTTARIDSTTMATAQRKVEEAFEVFQTLKLDPVMYVDLLGAEVPKQKIVAQAADYNILFKKWLYSENLNFVWRGNVRIAIQGPNGSGKTTLIKALLGDTFESQGELKRIDLATLYVDQHCRFLKDELSALENVRAVSRMSETEIRNNLARLLFTGEMVHQKVGQLSGGERLRAALACGLLREEKPNVLILDEPTNNLDLANIQFLERLIAQFKGAVLVVSHDDVFLKKCGLDMVLDL